MSSGILAYLVPEYRTELRKKHRVKAMSGSCVQGAGVPGRLQVVCATGVTLEVGYGPSKDFVVGGAGGVAGFG